MKHRTTALAASVLAFGATYVSAQTQAHAVLVDPNNSDLVWTVNHDNDSVSQVNVATGAVVAEIAVGAQPNHLAFNAAGTKLLVVNRRGNVPLTTNFVTPFTGAEIRGSISVIDVATKTVESLLTDVGTEPYGIALSPNGKFFVVTAFRSSEVLLLDATTYAELARHEYDDDLSHIAPGKTIDQIDTDFDGVPDLANPRLFSVTADSAKIYVTHWKSPWISILDVTLDGSGVPTAVAEGGRINQDDYDLHPINNPIPNHTVASQGDPTFSDDIAISPDGTRALVPQVLLNINFDTTHDFAGAIAGAFANRVYPSLTMLDLVTGSYNAPGDASNRLHHELTDTLTPAKYVPFGGQGRSIGGGIVTLGGSGSPVLGGSADFVLSGVNGAGVLGFVWYGIETNIPVPPLGTLLVDLQGSIAMSASVGDQWAGSIAIPNSPVLDGQVVSFQGATFNTNNGDIGLSNGVRVVLGTTGTGLNKMGYRAGQPYRADYNAAGDKVLMLNQGSEDVFLYDVNGSDMTLQTVFPPRHGHVERTPLDLTTAIGDMPIGWTVVPDPATSNDDALIYIQNEVTTSLSVLRVDYATGVITKEADQIVTITGPDQKTVSERIGQELFHDASRAQTTGNFNNSCYSCHAEGGEDGKSWDRPAGPRTTMPVYGGPLGSGLLLWKGVRVNLGETGPMFGGENGGTGIMSDVEQQGLIDYHKVIPFPLNPNLDPVTGDLTSLAAYGQDLFFGTNDTGLNPTQRAAGCIACHPKADAVNGSTRLFTADFLDPIYTDGLEFGYVHDDNCLNLQENIAQLNIRAVNSQVNGDEDLDGFPDFDRNLDGYSDIEGYTPIHPDSDDNFERDDPNSYPCPLDPFFDPLGPKKVFNRKLKLFSIPTKLAVFHTYPYMHDNSLVSLRAIVDPDSQMNDPVYGSANYPTTFKWFNEFHDIRGHEDIVPQASKVQVSLVSTDKDADIEAILAFISSL
ncbi:YncE family protein [Engelhardtia mirabilis]|uniref:Cytochrome c domain-containing protein n=1 Tax=Engelhardtia mirabilis TaxID=2528011 RepID=A0A518BSZ6_9BACT|nr:hypothetical protein Pla133_52120 [Planctomycetes bacterium Pla133]QDV04414.1 hypothetical protein Pla86_52090 [Planctomycetes bacterium Pla86]